jgi:hypothetical protein
MHNISSHRESWQGGLGKKGPTVIGLGCCGDPALVGKSNKIKNKITAFWKWIWIPIKQQEDLLFIPIAFERIWTKGKR